MTRTTVRRVTAPIAMVAALTGTAACDSAEPGAHDGRAGRHVPRVSPAALAALRSADRSTGRAAG
ncbi:hypothetical protein [Streptomyces sp. NPDC003697]